jgi:hypothetical protein
MASRSLDEIIASGARVSMRELFAALRSAGHEVMPTSKPTHFKLRCERGIVIIATKRDDILPVCVSRMAQALGLREGASDD